MFLVALFIIDKTQRRASVVKEWRGLTKITGWCFIVFGLWIILVPLVYGDESLFERLRGVPRPLEIALWIWGAFVFAKDKYFNQKLLLTGACACIFGVTFQFIQRVYLGFSPETHGWIFGMPAVWSALSIICLLPWLVYLILRADKSFNILFYGMVLIGALFVILVTYSSTMWFSFLSLFVILAFVLLLNNKYRPTKQVYCIMLLLLCLIMMLFVTFEFYAPKINDRICDRICVELNQLSSINKNFDTFTTKRELIWIDAVNIIKQRPVYGYGWIDYSNTYAIKRCDKRIIDSHPHSSYLEAAFHTGIPGMSLFLLSLLLFSLICIKIIFIEHTRNVIAFAALLMLGAYVVGGFAESFFFLSRGHALLFWVPVSLLLTNNKCVLDND